MRHKLFESHWWALKTELFVGLFGKNPPNNSGILHQIIRSVTDETKLLLKHSRLFKKYENKIITLDGFGGTISFKFV